MTSTLSLAAIRVLTDEALDAAKARFTEIGGVVNWARLRCNSAERYETDIGDSGVRVYVEEACPSASSLRLFVRNHLAAAGQPNIDVITEW